MHFARNIALILCLLLGACASLPQQPPPAGEAFYLLGRVSVKYGDTAASGKIAWEHDGNGDDLLLSTPFGQGIAHIVLRDAMATLTTSEQKVYRAGDVETLTEQVLGWRLPLAGLPDWVRGRPAPGAPAQSRLDEARRMAELRQSGWLVEYLGYRGDSGLPDKLRLSRADMEIRLVIDEWRSAP